jgi:ParB family transcriptional regulator, chromosome partitioning protein
VADPPQRLGRGLAALLGGAPPAGAPPQAVAGLVELPVAAIRPNPKQPRRRFEPVALDALVESLRANGLVQPVVVRPIADGAYELIAGERRWQAAQRAGLERIPALVRDALERERLELALIENVVREDLNPMELARAVAALVEDFGQTHAQVATTLGRSRSAISNLLRLLELPDPVQELVQEGTLSEGHARAVLMADGARSRRELAERAVAEGLSVRQVEGAARAGAARRRPPQPAFEPSEVTDRAVDRLYGLFEAPVRVKRRPATGEIVVELRFADEDALRRGLDRLG